MFRKITEFLARTFGWAERMFTSCSRIGIFNTFKIELLERVGSRCTYGVRLTEQDRLVKIRCATSDAGTFASIFVDMQYPKLDGHAVKNIIDAGANVGYSVLFFKSLFPHASVVAIEADPENFRLCVENTKALCDVEVINAALWSKTGKLSINNRGVARTDSIWVSESSSDSKNLVNAITISEIVREKQWDSIDLLKIDIEGAERALFSDGCEDWLQKVQILIVELHEDYAPGCGRAFASKASGFNFLFYHSNENYILIREKAMDT